MTQELEARLAMAIGAIDVAQDPARVEQGARILGRLQELSQERTRLAAQAEAFMKGANRQVEHKSLADWAEEVLLSSEGPRRYREIAAEIRARGFQHARMPKSPDQLADSVWSAMYEDSRERFVKVGRGIWDLSARHASAAPAPSE